MKKLRIQKMAYTNQGTANISLKGVKEYHAIFKFDTDKEAEDFIRKVNKWYNALEEVGKKVMNVINLSEEAKKRINDGLIEKAKERNIKKQSDEAKEPIPEKRKAGRPAKADIQG